MDPWRQKLNRILSHRARVEDTAHTSPATGDAGRRARGRCDLCERGSQKQHSSTLDNVWHTAEAVSALHLVLYACRPRRMTWLLHIFCVLATPVASPTPLHSVPGTPRSLLASRHTCPASCHRRREMSLAQLLALGMCGQRICKSSKAKHAPHPSRVCHRSHRRVRHCSELVNRVVHI